MPEHLPMPADSSKPSTDGQANSKAVSGVCDLLDFITIVSAALFLLFVVFWLAGVLNGSNAAVANFPDWLKSALKTGRGLLTAAGSTAVLQVVRARLNRGTGPQYILWTLAMFLVLGGSSIGLSKILKTPEPQPVSGTSADLFFNANYPDGTPIEYVHHYPRQIIEDITRQTKEVIDPPSYLAHISLPPDEKTQYSADFRPVETDSRLKQPGSREGFYSLCIQRSLQPAVDVTRIFLKCNEAGFTCDIDTTKNNGLAENCSTDKDDGSNPIRQWMNPESVSAASNQILESKVPFWTVPLLGTLQKMNDKKRVGYTQFDIELHPNGSLAGADTYQYRVVVNEQPIFFNGFPPEVLLDKFVPGSILRFSFGLENLSFSGVDKGYEDLALELTFFNGKTKVQEETITRQYVALRDAPAQQFTTKVGSISWTGKYIAPPNENKYEIFVNSTPNVNEAMSLKTRLDRMRLSIDAKPAVLVVRPPLRIPPFYGVVLGVVQPTGQVQFTFDQDEARKVCSWALGHGKDTHILRSDLRRYDIATRGYAPCNQ